MTEKFTNRLIDETSPYLLQHAHNPVQWYPWGEEALQRAKAEDKPILLSVGYSACHWCHVMEHESFEDEAIATLMNEHFINIKVDREERPDLDEIYMQAVQMMTGSGGWPMTVFLTPDLKPFYGGTYFPPDDRYGRPGFPRVLTSLAEHYRTHREEVDRSGEQLTAHIQQLFDVHPSPELLTDDIIQGAVRDLEERFDSQHGGFGGAPKFPPSMSLSLLLRVWRQSGRAKVLHMVEQTLEGMARGGMYDQLGGGFHRYSTDDVWLVPHFEKMLYDNALLSRAYLEAYQATGKELYRRVVTETLDYVLREMTHPTGGFYSTQDADSEGEEGKFFVWRPEEIKALLGDTEGEAFCQYYGVTPDGNFEHATSILHLDRTPEQVAGELGMSPEELQTLISKAKPKLFETREKRVKPGLDDKTLTSWNGLMIGSMALGYRILEDPRYLEAARSAAGFILREMRRGDLLLRTHRGGESKLNAYLDDYSFLLGGLIDLYEATFDLQWLREAKMLAKTLIEQFWDNRTGAFFFTGKDHEQLITRSKSCFDTAIPSGNSVATMSLLRLGALTGDSSFSQKALDTMRTFRTAIERIPAGCGQMLCALDFYLESPKEVAIVGPKESPETLTILKAIHSRFVPNKIVALLDPAEEGKGVEDEIPLLKEKTMQDGKPTVYVCKNYTCQAPTTDPNELVKALKA